MPFLRRYAAFLRVVSVLVYDTGFHDLEDFLAVDVAADWTFAFASVGVVAQRLEIRHCLHRVAVVDDVAALVHHPQLVKHLENLARRLVDVYDHNFAVQRLLLQ